MSFQELVQTLKQAPLDETRKESEGYFEFVLNASDLSVVYPALEQYFGVPFKPPGIKPSKEASLYAKEYGGIEKQQTLYYREDAGVSNCAMIWPWNDGVRVTVKVARGQIKK